MSRSNNKTNRRVRCIDCKHAKPMGEFTIRCDIHKVGKAKNPIRLCDYYEDK